MRSFMYSSPRFCLKGVKFCELEEETDFLAVLGMTISHGRTQYLLAGLVAPLPEGGEIIRFLRAAPTVFPPFCAYLGATADSW